MTDDQKNKLYQELNLVAAQEQSRLDIARELQLNYEAFKEAGFDENQSFIFCQILYQRMLAEMFKGGPQC